MNSMFFYIHPIFDKVDYSFNNQEEKVGQWAWHHIRFIEDMSYFLQQNAKMTTFISINALFFFAIHFVVNDLDEKLIKVRPPLTAEQRMIKRLLLDGMLLGGSTACVNFLFSKILNYPLNKTHLKMISFMAIVSHTFLNFLGKCLQNKQPILGMKKDVKGGIFKPDVFKNPSQKFSEQKRHVNRDLSVILEGDFEESFYLGLKDDFVNLDTSSDGDEISRL